MVGRPGVDVSAPEGEPKRRLELVITGEAGIDSIPPPSGERDPTGKISTTKRLERDRLESTVQSRVATSLLGGRIPFGSREAKMIRSLARTVALTGLFSIAIGAIVVAQLTLGHGNVPSVVAGVLVGAIGLWSLLAGFHFHRVGRTQREDAAQLVAAFGNLRSIFLLKAIGLFLALALSCFAFSIVASLLALL